MVTDSAEVLRQAESKGAENLEFRRYVAAHHVPLEPFHVLAGEVQSHTDCTTCANCCRYTLVNVNRAEIEVLAAYLGMDPHDVVRLHTMPDPQDHSGLILKNEANACTFLHGNLCMVYEARPKACRTFPHAAERETSLGGRMSSLCRSAGFCPIVYDAMEAWKKSLGWRHK